ncbi:MAG TPA: aminotransferase class III-fold pyridoxal phosphate-dependent enzyme, partial [Steroidobacteraceae bacterium]|nr:aminotransferase class III-fold pyridoxal phosphate-dependent enzyme [Steroidobacteraceae bacterium]
CLGKGITGGYLPMSATVAADRVYSAFLGPDLSTQTLYHGHSYGGNALAAAVARKHLELIQSSDVLSNVRARSQQLEHALLNKVGTLTPVKSVRVCGLMAAVELDVSCDALQPRRVCAAMVKRGVLSRSLGSAITIVPPLTTTAGEIERIVDTLHDSIAACMR